MPELLLELFSEEIPARMQGPAAAALERAVNQRLANAGFATEGVKALAGPRRLTVVATGLPARQPDRREEKKGPRVGAPERAVEGFLKSAGLSSLDQCEQREDKKGSFWVAVIDQKGRDTADLIAGFVLEIIAKFSWPKSMRWGSSSSDDGALRWVRPLHGILCAFDGEIVDFDIGGVRSGDKTQGHRFMAPGEVQARNFEDYASRLRAAKVILDTEERKEIIARSAATLCQAQGLELVEDAGLLSEVAGLTEWPVAMLGSFDEKFLSLPDEVLTASMRGHQKYFSVQDLKTGRLANKFVCVANIEAPDGGKAMREGYERVLTARLSDAWYLYNQDLKTPLEARIEDLDKVTFFEGLGSVGDKARRVAALAKEIAPLVDADPELAERAALLAKADLVTGMVKEFPELQGVMGRYYYLAQAASSSPVYGVDWGPNPNRRVAEGDGGGSGANAPSVTPDKSGATAPRRAGEQQAVQIGDAIRDHYKPKGQDDDVPTAPVSVAVALADKIDTLTAFYVINKKPTGSGDPFALRRAALGVISIVLKNSVRLHLDRCLADQIKRLASALPNERTENLTKFELLTFIVDRLKVHMRDCGHRHDYVEASIPLADLTKTDDLVLIVSKLEALEAFLKTDDGENLAAAYKRAANILKAEEKKDVGRVERSDTSQTESDGGYRPSASTRPTVEGSLLSEPEEKALFAALEAVESKAAKAVEAEDFEAAMTVLASLRAPLDAFFEKVTVNADDKALRANRLSLLARLRAATATVADFSKLEG